MTYKFAPTRDTSDINAEADNINAIGPTYQRSSQGHGWHDPIYGSGDGGRQRPTS